MFLKRTLVCLGVTAGLVTPDMASAQRSEDRAQFDARMNVLDRSLAELSIQIERLKASNQDLERKLDAMRTNYDQRLERMEKGAAPRAAPPNRSKP
jgi:predicted RNase H-like nuclease (RuvC/YqgF family)